ncbi:hypothetical protein [Penaeicola halotolerans]|uniref:hypothetical protein n=1 Tax=Penaeicola halotolerans TaxID=2793196 RepID=UPI001CF86CFD|nr:hypothetical protein [Penaeicola halotolerans]
MKGLKISYQGEETVYGQLSDDTVVTLIIGIRRGEDQYRIEGGVFDPKANTHYDWIESLADEGSKMSIKFLHDLDVNDYTEPIAKRQEDTEDTVNQKKVAYFYQLEKELKQKGLL